MNSDTNNGNFGHEPVLVEEILSALKPHAGGIYLDCTVGTGGHAAAILDTGGKSSRLIGVDRDEEVLHLCRKRLQPYRGRVELFCERFEKMKEAVAGRKLDGILMDLGISSYALDNPQRGFSFQTDGPLDMRMDRRQPLTAEELVNNLPQKELAGIFKNFGEVRFAGKLAGRIVKERSKEKITSTLRLASIVKRALPQKRTRLHPATKAFMALRIAVNGELEMLEGALTEAVESLLPGGRLAVISFHSLEDRIVKRTFARLAKGCVCPPKIPVCVCGKESIAKIVYKKPVTPAADEIKSNPRSRSAKLRVIERIAA